VLGAFPRLLLTEEVLKEVLNVTAKSFFGKSGWSEYWPVVMGPLLVLSVIFFRRGVGRNFLQARCLR